MRTSERFKAAALGGKEKDALHSAYCLEKGISRVWEACLFTMMTSCTWFGLLSGTYDHTTVWTMAPFVLF